MAKTLMQFLGVCAALSVTAWCAYAGEVVPQVVIEGKVYQDVRWGPVNQGNVVIFHNRGIKVVPLDKLPAEYQAMLGAPSSSSSPSPSPSASTPAPASVPLPPAAPSEPQGITAMPPLRSSDRDADWEAYNRDRKTKVVLGNKLVSRSSLTSLVGFLGSPARFSDGETLVRGFVLELASRKAGDNGAAAQFSLRPNLWERTGKKVILRDYKPPLEPGGVVHVFAKRVNSADDYDIYEVATEPSYEQWKQLRFTNVNLP